MAAGNIFGEYPGCETEESAVGAVDNGFFFRKTSAAKGQGRNISSLAMSHVIAHVVKNCRFNVMATLKALQSEGGATGNQFRAPSALPFSM